MALTKSRKQRLRRIERAFEKLWVAVRTAQDPSFTLTHEAYQDAGSALNYLYALARKAK